MLQTWGVTVWSGLSVTGTHSSDPVRLHGCDFVRTFIAVTIQSFTYIQVAVEVLMPTGLFKPLVDPFQNSSAQRFTADYSGTSIIGAFSTLSAQRASQLPIVAYSVRFSVTVSGASGTPGTLSLTAQGLRRSVGSYQTR